MSTPAEPQPTPADEAPADGGRRALPFAIAGVALLVAIVLYAVLSRENDSNPVDDVSAALQANAAVLAGPLNPTALQHTRCTHESGDRYRCTPVMDNSTEKAITVIYAADHTITKRLAGSNLTEAPRGGDEVAAALDADELATLGRTVKYGCAFTSTMNPDGSTGAGPGGFRCATLKPPAGADAPLQRYVQFTADGSVSRDFMITG